MSIPLDENGFLGRECPEKACLGYFKVKPGTGLTGPDLQCHCPYCGHVGDTDTFWTPDQLEYAKSVAVRQVTDDLFKELKKSEFDHPAHGPFGIGVSMKVTRGQPWPIRQYREKRLETSVVCEQCTLEYSVFGLFAYCPDCGGHNSLGVLRRNLALVAKQLELTESLTDAAFAQHLIDDALENCVSAFDGFGREAIRVRASRSSNPSRAEQVSFQNLDRACDNIRACFGIELKALAGRDWQAIRRAFLKRHVIAHRSGIVDDRYRNDSGDLSTPAGRRLPVERQEVEVLAATLDHLAAELVRLLPHP